MRHFCIVITLLFLCPLYTFCQETIDTTKPFNLTEAKVITSKIVGSDAVLMEEMKKQNVIVTGISAEQINKGQDKDASEIIKRIQGVTLNDERFIVVRGLNERYNTTWLNNTDLPSSEADKRAFSFDAIPSTFIDQVLIYKTPSADLPGDFSGGAIKIITKTAPIGSSLTISLNGFFRDGSSFQTMRFTQGSNTDFLGYDNGFRKIPDGIPHYLSKSSTATTELFKNTWVLHDQQSSPDFRCNIAYTKGLLVRNFQLGIVAGVNYDNSYTRYFVHRQDFESGAFTSENNDSEYTNYRKIGAILNLKMLIGDNDKIEFRNLFNQAGRTQTLTSGGIDLGLKTQNYSFGYESKTLYSSQLAYSHSFKNNTEYNATVGWSYNMRSDPDLRRIAYEYSNDPFFRSNIPAGSGQIDASDGATRFYSVLKENIYCFNQYFKTPAKIAGFPFSIKLGTDIEYKERNFSSRLFGYTLPVSAHRRPFSALPVDSIFSNKYIEYADTVNGKPVPVGFKIYEDTNPEDSYFGTNVLYAPFLCIQLPITKKLNIETGIRYEYNIQSLRTVVGVDSVNIDLKTTFALPSINARYDISKNQALRFSYGKTINRPEFREWAPFLYYDFALQAITHGSLFPSVDHQHGYILQTANIDNYDISYDKYFKKNDFFHVGIFYKYFVNPIEQIVESRQHRFGISKEITFLNLHQATCTGIEFETRKNLGFIAPPGRRFDFSHLNIVANLTLVKSVAMTTNDSFGIKRALQGQAPYLINFGLFYNTKKMNASIIYNIIGPRIFLAGGNDGPHTPMGSSIGEMPRNELDLSFGVAVSRKIFINAGIKDILNQPVQLVEDTNNDGKFETKKGDNEVLKYRKGSYYSLGISVKL